MKPQLHLAKRLGLVAVCVCLFVPATGAQECPQFVSWWLGGGADGDGIDVYGNYAYFGSDTAFRVADVSVPASPQMVAELELGAFVEDISVSGDHAFVAATGRGLCVIDVSSPWAPVEVGVVDTPGTAWGVEVSGAYAYVADVTGGLRVIDVSEPSAPAEVASLDMPPQYPYDVVVSGAYAYLVSDGWAGAFHVIDVSEPSAPVEVFWAWYNYTANGVAIAGDHVYAAGWDWGVGTSLNVMDVSTPSAPVWLNRVSIGGGDGKGQAVSVLGQYAYVAYGGYSADGGLSVVDVSTPSAPVEVGFFDTMLPARSVAVSDGYVFVTTNGYGWSVFRECSLLFADGFESGDTSAWSTTQP
jgi:hypothetical protein